MKFCNVCGGPVALQIPEDDDRERHVCQNCGAIHYVNPKVIVGCLPKVGDRILLCKRAIEPRYGKWTLPAGFMENGETSAGGAARETWEEAAAKAMDVELDLGSRGLGLRGKRFALVAEDGVVKHLALQDGGELTSSSAEETLKAL